MRLRLLHVNDLGIVSTYVVIGCSFLKYSKDFFFFKEIKEKNGTSQPVLLLTN